MRLLFIIQSAHGYIYRKRPNHTKANSLLKANQKQKSRAVGRGQLLAPGSWAAFDLQTIDPLQQEGLSGFFMFSQ